jgi:hypothetical protein
VRLRGVPEEPFRIYQQLRLAVEAIAAVRGHESVQREDMSIVERIALSSIFYRRYEAVRALQASPSKAITVADTLELMDLADDQARLWCNDLVKVGLFTNGDGAYRAAEPFRALIHGPSVDPILSPPYLSN